MLLLIVFTGSFLLVFAFSNQKTPNQAPSKDLKEVESQDTSINLGEQGNDVVTAGEFTYAGWIPNWGTREGISSLERNPDLFNTLSPVWYEINPDGTLVDKRPGNWREVADFASENEIELIPAIAMFDHELFTQVLQNQNALDAHVNAITTEVNDQEYSGIDLDYESTKLSDKDKFFEFLVKLDERLERTDKTLIFTVLPQWDEARYTALLETRQVQDWERIAEHADYIRIMAYDYTFAGSPNPGPIAPLNWVEDVLEFATSRVAREQIILGVHLYSYEWWCSQSNTECNLEFTPLAFANTGDGARARSYTYDTVKTVLGEFGDDLSEFDGEKIYRYEKDGERRVLVFIDPAGVQARVNLAKQYGVKGVSFWRVGGEDDLLDDLE